MDGLTSVLLFLAWVLVTVLLAVLLWRVLQKKNSVAIQSSTVLLESVQKVFKLVSVEGNYSEVLHYREKHRIFFDLIPQEKKALVVVKGKVLMGMDMQKAQFDVDEQSKRITLKHVPEPEVIGLETDVEYFDVRNTIFRRFKAEELTDLQLKAKQLIRDKADEGELRLTAERQAAQIVEAVRAMVEGSGWSFSITAAAQRLLDGK